MDKGNGSGGMDSAMWMMQGKGNGRDAAASLPPRHGANVFAFAVAVLHSVSRRSLRGFVARKAGPGLVPVGEGAFSTKRSN